MIFFIEKKIFSWNTTINIRDENDNTIYYAETQTNSFVHMINVYSKKSNSSIGIIRQRNDEYVTGYDIDISGEIYGCIERQLTFLYPNYILKFGNYMIKGDIEGRHYMIVDANDEYIVLEVSDNRIDIKDKENIQYGILIVMALIAICA